MSSSDPGRWAPALSLGLVALGLVMLLLPSFTHPGPPMDEGLLLVYPEQILRGAVPQRDFQTIYGPGDMWVLAAAYRAFGVGLPVERTVGLVYRLAIVLGVFMIARIAGLRIALLAAAASALMAIQLELPAFAWLGGLACLTWSVWFLWRGRPAILPALAAGLLGSAGLLFRPDLAVAVALSVLPWMPSASRARRAAYLAGLLIGIIPFGIHILMASPAAVFGSFATAVLQIQPARRLPIPPPDPTLWILVLESAGFALAAVLIGFRGSGKEPWLRAVAAAGLVCLGLFPQVLQRADSIHLNDVGCFAVGMLPLTAWTLFRKGGLPPRVTRFALPVAVVVTIFTAAPSLLVAAGAGVEAAGIAHRHHYEVSHGDRRFAVVDERQAAHLQALVADVDRDTVPGQSLIVGPGDLSRTNYGDTFLYYLFAELRPGTYYLEMNPRGANAPNSRLGRELGTADVVILNTDYDRQQEPNASRNPGSPEAAGVLHGRFCLRSQHGPYQLMLPCDRVG